MKDELVSFEVAKLAKEKGFNIESDKYYCIVPIEEQKVGDVVLEKETYTHIIMGKGEAVWFRYAPTTSQSLLQKWLREKHSIDVIVDKVNSTPSSRYYFNIYSENIEDEYDITEFDAYEEALEIGLEQALKLIDYVTPKESF